MFFLNTIKYDLDDLLNVLKGSPNFTKITNAKSFLHNRILRLKLIYYSLTEFFPQKWIFCKNVSLNCCYFVHLVDTKVAKTLDHIQFRSLE